MARRNLAQERIGEIKTSKSGFLMEVMKYERAEDIWVRFENGTLVHTTWLNFLRGSVKNPFEKTIYETGYIGQGVYKSKVNGKHTAAYETWRNLMDRCYNEKTKISHPSYTECTVTDEWHNFQNFASWYDENYYTINRERMELDKDILVKGNKIYSPDTCVFVPKCINLLFTKTQSRRGDLPIGVSVQTSNGKYKAYCSINGKRESLGCFSIPEEAFRAYKSAKEKIVREVAEEYKNHIPHQLYHAMINYKVDITD